MIRNTLLFTLLIPMFLIACKEEDENVPTSSKPDVEQGLVCELGQASGDVVSKIIGEAGGSISTADSRITLEIPAGTFDGNQTVSIEAITNTNPSGRGVGYRLAPHDLQFKKPVKITFNYGEENMANSIPEALLVAYQDEKGVWQAVGGAEADKVNKTISVATTHFSDWTLFDALTIEPWSATIAPGENIDLKVYRFIEFDEDEFQLPMPGDLSPVVGRKEVDDSMIEKWELGGPGVLESEGNSATYYAPNSIPDVNPVAVSARIASRHNNLLLLVSNIMIAADGITFRVNDGEWIHAPVPVGGHAEGLVLLSGAPIVDNQSAGAVKIAWQGGGNNIVFQWKLEMPQFTYVKGNLQYHHFFAQPGSAIPSPGALHVTSSGKVGEYITGTFILDQAGILDMSILHGNPWIGKAKIEGFFRVKRTQ